VNWSGNGTNLIPKSCCSRVGGCRTGESIPYPIPEGVTVWSEVCSRCCWRSNLKGQLVLSSILVL